jgi:hypothetical protein
MASKGLIFDASGSLMSSAAAFLARTVPFGVPTEGAVMQRQFTVCDSCGDPASYQFKVDAVDEHRCEECARLEGARLRGEAAAALETLGFAVQIARNALVNDDQLRAALEAILTEQHSEGHYPVGGEHVLGGGSRVEQPWASPASPFVALAVSR